MTAPGDRVRELARLDSAGSLPETLLFWGHRPPKGGGVGKSCLSQWYPAPFTVDGVPLRPGRRGEHREVRL
ncbi:MAG: hypothetical protein ACRDP6_27995 [Actinoallomurus sp.]